MSRRTRKEQSSARAAALDSLLRMEPQLRLLEGSVALLMALGETAEAVEPIALATLAKVSDDALTELRSSWRECLEQLRG